MQLPRALKLNHNILTGFLLGFTGIIYELVLAQVTSIYLGGTFHIYTLTFGIYTFCLGISSLFYEEVLGKKSEQEVFAKSQLILLLTVILLILLLVVWQQPEPWFFYVAICMVGILTGLELPLLFKMQKKFDGVLFSFDYFGMILASLCFSLILIYKTNLFLILGVALLINAVIYILYSKSNLILKFCVITITSVFIFKYKNIAFQISKNILGEK